MWSSKQKAQLIILLIFCNGVPDAQAVLRNLLTVGELFLTALTSYQELADENRAKALISMGNFLDQPLTQCAVIVTKGVTISAIPATIASGSLEGIAVEQSEAFDGVDMTVSCRNNQQMRFLVHFDVDQDPLRGDREPNTLGVTIVEEVGNEFLANKSAFNSRHTLHNLGSEEFADPIQCTTDDIAVQVTMSTSHQCEIDIFVYPINIANFTANIERQNLPTQEELNNILNFPQSCESLGSQSLDPDDSGLASTILVVILVVSMGLVIVLGIAWWRYQKE